jgi:hypothetical protein
LVIVLIISFFFNLSQYDQIRNLKNKQNNIDSETKAQIQTLVNYLEDIDKDSLEAQMNLTYMAFIFSSYKENEIVSDTFFKLQNLIYSKETLSIDEARQISRILKEIIKPEKLVLDMELWKKLDNYIASISTK